jgi:hypothetical protein
MGAVNRGKAQNSQTRCASVDFASRVMFCFEFAPTVGSRWSWSSFCCDCETGAAGHCGDRTDEYERFGSPAGSASEKPRSLGIDADEFRFAWCCWRIAVREPGEMKNRIAIKGQSCDRCIVEIWKCNEFERPNLARLAVEITNATQDPPTTRLECR